MNLWLLPAPRQVRINPDGSSYTGEWKETFLKICEGVMAFEKCEHEDGQPHGHGEWKDRALPGHRSVLSPDAFLARQPSPLVKATSETGRLDYGTIAL